MAGNRMSKSAAKAKIAILKVKLAIMKAKLAKAKKAIAKKAKARKAKAKKAKAKKARAKKRGKARQSSPEPTGWKDLPIEVRLMIYKHCFKGAMLYLGDSGLPDVTSSQASSKSAGQIARVSKEIHHESESLLYCETTLVFHGFSRGPGKPHLLQQHIIDNLEYIKCIMVTTRNPVTLIHRNLRCYRALEVLRFGFRPLNMIPEITAGYGKHGYEIVSDNKLLTRYILRQLWAQWEMRDDVIRWRDPINYDALGRLYTAKTRTYRIEVAISVRYYTASDLQEQTTKVRAFTCI
jgi:hypothetical protein